MMSLLLFWNLNSYFSKYKACEIFNFVSKIERTNPNKLLQQIKKNNNEKYKEQILTSQALNKYWKEPMAWH